MRLHQRHENIELRLDGDAYAWVWTPNLTDDERLQVDLLPDLAIYCHLGRGKPRESATWERDSSLTLITSVSLGSNGSATVGGDPISEDAVAGLASAGYLAAIRVGQDAETTADDETEDP